MMEGEALARGETTDGAQPPRVQLKTRLHRRMLETLDLSAARNMPVDQLHRECSRRIDALLKEEHCPLSAPERTQLLHEVLDDIFGLGPLEEFLHDPTISDVLVNGHRQIYVERGGVLELTRGSFRDETHLLQVIQRIGARVGRRIDEGSPMLDARLSDGSRANAIIPPLAVDGPALSIRRFSADPLNADRLVKLGALADEMAIFLKACVRCRLNILISGGTGTGKTTLLNMLSSWIPDGERLVTIEDAAELRLQRTHVVRLEVRPPNIEGKGEVTQRDLLRNSLRMRPDRILIGEVRGAEALDMLQAMNTGHEGSMTTVHANSPRDALRRLENMVSMAGLNYPVHVIRQQIESAVNLVIQVGRVTGGGRKILSIVEVTGMEGDVICMHDLFSYVQVGVGGDGRAQGHFEACGVRPGLLERFKAQGVELPNGIFQHHILPTGGGVGAS